MKNIKILGDVHGKFDQLNQLNLFNEYVVQVGDLGFDYIPIYQDYDLKLFKVILGNHDNYDDRPKVYDLGDYGIRTHNGIDFFIVRGAVSIDFETRVREYLYSGKKTWWYEEELSSDDLAGAIEMYGDMKPEVMITHDAPLVFADRLSTPALLVHYGFHPNFHCRTQSALQVMFAMHKPKLWFCGHFHQNRTENIEGTQFYCINELNYLTLNEDLTVELS